MKQYYLGIEFGSTRVKAVLIDGEHRIVKSGDYTWKSSLENGVWTYHMEDVQTGLRTAIRNLGELPGAVSAMGISGMMHGYLAFDKDWNLLAPFRTWQNTMTGEAAEQLTAEFGFNIPQRWSIAHLYQAILNGEAHVKNIAHITTLAGYVHYLLTGENVLGVGEASGMFPIDSEALDYDAAMLEKFDALIAKYGFAWTARSVLPKVLTAGQAAGALTQAGSTFLDGLLSAGIPFCPPEGDAGTGMTATNAVAPRTGNVSAGTSIFAMVVLEKPLSKVYQEIDSVDILEHPDNKGMMAALNQGDYEGVCAYLSNVMETVTAAKRRQIGEIKSFLAENGADGTLMSGSGPTVYGLFSDESRAKTAAKMLRRRFADTFLTETCN